MLKTCWYRKFLLSYLCWKEKKKRHRVFIISTRCRFSYVAPMPQSRYAANGVGQILFCAVALPRNEMLGRKSRPYRTMSVLYLICNIFSLLLHNFNVFGVNTATIQNTILYFMGFKPLLGGVLIVVHIWAILGFQYKIRNKDFHLYYYLLGSVACSHTTDFLERNTAIC